MIWSSVIMIYDMIVGDHDIWYDRSWSSYMKIIYDDHIWWWYMMIMNDDHIWWSYMMIMYGDHVWWSYMIIMYDVWWSCLMIMIYDMIVVDHDIWRCFFFWSSIFIYMYIWYMTLLLLLIEYVLYHREYRITINNIYIYIILAFKKRWRCACVALSWFAIKSPISGQWSLYMMMWHVNTNVKLFIDIIFWYMEHCSMIYDISMILDITWIISSTYHIIYIYIIYYNLEHHHMNAYMLHLVLYETIKKTDHKKA